MQLKDKKVLVVGLGRSGLAAARLAVSQGAKVTITDKRGPEHFIEASQALAGQVTLKLGGHHEQSFLATDLIVLSPGVPEFPELQAAQRHGVPIMGELELSYRFVQAPILAITGTNGKSTTTSLLGAIIQASGRPTFTGGNLGAPLAEAVGTEAAGSGGALVLELSSFQLETVEQFHAHIALLLNLSEDHLDRYARYEDYRAAKSRIFERQTVADWAIINGNADQSECYDVALAGAASIVSFRLGKNSPNGISHYGAWLGDGELQVQIPQQAIESIPLSCLQLAGQHNIQNALAALLAARLFGVDIKTCEQAIRNFRGLPHRMELVAEVAGVYFYNDSKATNVGSVVGSLTGFNRPVILIAGGKDKGGDYNPLALLLKQVGRHAVLIGAAADKIEHAIASAIPTHRAADLSEAVQLGAKLARPGDAVVLSPACSSYDMFKNFEERGKVFVDAVYRLRNG